MMIKLMNVFAIDENKKKEAHFFIVFTWGALALLGFQKHISKHDICDIVITI